jgi:uncharacterized UPF0160 family protein
MADEWIEPRAMTAPKILRVLTTHGGKFHCDEVFAYVVLKLALGRRCQARIIRCSGRARRS